MVNINEDMTVEEVHMEGPIAENEASFKNVDEQIPIKLDTGRLEEANTIWKQEKLERRIDITNEKDRLE